MKQILSKIEKVKKEQPIKAIINSRIKEFEKILHEKNKERIFSELCFCLLTANFQAEKSIKLQNELLQDFFKTNEQELARKLKEKGHRFWPQRASHIIKAREHKEILHKFILENKDPAEIRIWLAENVNGLGMKESSHFLRNIGYKDFAIIDFHIVDLLVAENLIQKPKTLTPKRYLEIENVLKEIAKKANLSQAELDLYLWYIETGKVLK